MIENTGSQSVKSLLFPANFIWGQNSKRRGQSLKRPAAFSVSLKLYLRSQFAAWRDLRGGKAYIVAV